MENIQGKNFTIEIIPKKRVLQSIARDINLNMAILELIDNSIDAWKRNNTGNKLVIAIKVTKGDKDNGKLSQLDYEDNAGGIPVKKITELFTLGDTGASQYEKSIGEFGVGLKRALFSLSKEFIIESKAPQEDGFTCKVDVSSFLKDPEWKLEYSVGSSAPLEKSIIRFLGLNYEIGDKTERDFRKVIAETYSHTISNNGEIFVNNTEVTFHKFDEWTEFAENYSEYSPKRVQSKVEVEGKKVEVDITVGLMKTFHTTGEYGFYIYCNDRLAVKDGKEEQLGFNGKEFTYPHNRISRFRCEVRLNGPRSLVPWNSTKSGINYNLPLMSVLLPGLKKLAKPYLNFSNRLSTPGKSGINGLVERKANEVNTTKEKDLIKYFETLPDLKSRAKRESFKRGKSSKTDPWKKSLMDAVTIIDSIIRKKTPEYKNRVAVLILDSTIEVSMRAYLKNVVNTDESRKEGNERQFYKLMDFAKKRSGTLNVDKSTWVNIAHFHEIRDKLYHEFSDIDVTEGSIESYKEAALDMLEKLLSIMLR